MADRIKLLVQKRTSLKSQVTNLTNVVEKGSVSHTTLKLRIARLTELYNAFEEFNDELLILNPNDTHEEEFVNIQERFFSLAGTIEEITSNNASPSNSTISNETGSNSSSVRMNNKRRIKLPEATLPTFDGKFENWLSFKNAFRGMIGVQTDLSDIDKLHYLRAALVGEAANKIKIFETDDITYQMAWELLERSYEVKRILISRHLSAIINAPILDKETTSGLSKLADETQQHSASLKVLGVEVGSEILVHIIENKLPKVTLERWEATLERDEFPRIEQMYEFLYKSAVLVSRRDRTKTVESERIKGEPPTKRKRFQTFMTSSNKSRKCVVCDIGRHPLYLCNKFKESPVQKRIETIKNLKLCYNCLRSHRDSPCKFSNYTICHKRHNTLLHLDNFSVSNRSVPMKTIENNDKST